MDEHPERWDKAMAQEQMPWPQYIVDSNHLDEIRQRYNFSAIPLIVFTDSNGREIKRYLGNKANNSTPYVTVIDGVLSGKNNTPN